ncbi:peroxisome biogenesis factor 1 [Anoplophora glabripennis]|uniref:peroxisome biogenesis factor 1 n=1 Tax=Anoplophora glabripennis TaxID=217634 RepID=UPI000875404B|nr:peroxisome biogenesis factor 1 [Anoplophora glabripennis]
MFDRILSVNYNSSKDCFIYLPSKYLKTGSCVQLTYGDNKIAYFSVSASTVKVVNECISLSSVCAKILEIEENELVRVSQILNLPTVNRITIAPVNSNEYEILELLAENVQSTLLDQIRVVNTGQKFVIWAGSNISIAVCVENVEPQSPGIIDFLTEVVIEPKSKDNYESNLLGNANVERNDNSVFDIDKLKLLMSYYSQHESQNNLQKFSNLKHNLVCRLVPINKLPFSDKIKSYCQYFNVFVSQESLPKSWLNNGSIIICSMKILTLDLLSEKVIYVRLFILEDLLGKSCSNLVGNIFVNDIIFEQFNCHLGCRVVLNYIEEIPVVNEISIYTKKIYLLVIEEKFKSYLIENCDGIMVLNPDILLNIGDYVKCNLKFSPAEAKFFVANKDSVKSCKFVVNEGTVLPRENVKNLSNCTTFLENISNYQYVVDKIITAYSSQEHNWENVLITGRAGTGKSTILKILAYKLNSSPNFIFTKTIQCKTIKGKTVDSMFKVFSLAFSELALYQPSVLLLDDLHLLCESIKGDDVAPNAIYSNRVSEMIHTCLKMFPRCNKIGICVTVESTAKLNKNLYSSRGSHLFKNLHSISDLTKADRIDFLKHFFEKYKLLDVNFDYISIKTEGFVIQDIIDFCNKSIFEAYKDDCDEENLVLNNNHFERALKNACVLSLQNVHLHSPGSKSFTDIGGLHDVKKILVESLMWPAQYPGIFAKAPLRLQSGLLLYGPPGTGKTLLAGAAAKHCGLRLISIKGPELLSKYIGASEQAVRDVFQKAQSARPCILFFDEFDSLAPRRGHDNTGVTDRVVNQLLTQLDGIESLSGVCVLAATSRPDLLDPALLRPGRLDRQILCPLPSKDDRLEILTILSKNLDLSEDVNLEAVASATKGYSGADLQSILYTAQLSTIDHLLDSSKESLAITKSQVTQKHLKEAISKTRPSLPEQERLKYERIYSKFERGNTIDEFRAGSKATLA